MDAIMLNAVFDELTKISAAIPGVVESLATKSVSKVTAPAAIKSSLNVSPKPKITPLVEKPPAPTPMQGNVGRPPPPPVIGPLSST